MMSNSTDISRLRHALEDAYPLGEIAAIESIPTDEEEYLKDAGVTLGAEVANLRSAFRVTSSSGSYFLKRVSSWVSDEQLRRVEAFLGWSQERELLISPKLISSQAGGGHINFGKDRYQLFEFVKQEKRQNWMNSQVSQSDCFAAGELLYRLHHTFCEYFSKDSHAASRESWTSEVLSESVSKWNSLVVLLAEKRASLPPAFSQLLDGEELLTNKLTAAVNAACNNEYSFNKHGVGFLVHGDFHPGNVLIDGEEGKSAWVIDFDHMHFSTLFFDLGYALVMFGRKKSLMSQSFIDWELARSFMQGHSRKQLELLQREFASDEVPGVKRLMKKHLDIRKVSELIPMQMTIACFLILDWAADRFLNGPKPFAALYEGIVGDMLHILTSENFEKSADMYSETLKELVG